MKQKMKNKEKKRRGGKIREDERKEKMAWEEGKRKKNEGKMKQGI